MPTTLDARQEKFDEYVTLVAQDRLLEFVTGLAFDDDGTRALRLTPSSQDLLSELWPRFVEDDDYPADWCDAEKKSAPIAARLLISLTTSEAQDALKAEAMRLALDG